MSCFIRGFSIHNAPQGEGFWKGEQADIYGVHARSARELQESRYQNMEMRCWKIVEMELLLLY